MSSFGAIVTQILKGSQMTSCDARLVNLVDHDQNCAQYIHFSELNSITTLIVVSLRVTYVTHRRN